ncbi:MAG: Na+/H+ antiporter NhaA [Actinomycetota bacterium]
MTSRAFRLNSELVVAAILSAAVLAGLGFGWLYSGTSFTDARHYLLEGPVQYLVIAPFFFLVGLELKRELTHGDLKPLRNLLPPLFGAILGVAFPAAWYLLLTAGTPAASGWPIPTATDVTFALAAFQVLGRSLPRAARTFLLAFAVIDDLIAVVLITLVFGLQGANGIVELIPVLVAFVTPTRWIRRFESWLLKYLNFFGLPVFAFLISAVRLPGAEVLASVVFWAVIGRSAWKWLGVYLGGRIGGIWASGEMRLPNRVLLAVSSLGGIGFTVAMLVSQLALGARPVEFAAAISATFAASAVSLLLGRWLLRRAQG